MDSRLEERLKKIHEHLPILKIAQDLYGELEASKKPTFSMIALKSEGKSIAEKEHRAYASKEWRDCARGVALAWSQYQHELRVHALKEMAYYAEQTTFKIEESVIRKQL